MEAIKSKVISLYSEYKEFESVVKKKNEELTNNKANLKEVIQGKKVEELQDVLVHVYVDTILYNKDLQILFLKLVNAVELYNEFSNDALPEEVLKFYSDMKTWAPKRVFVVEKGALVETESGLLEEERTKFLESDFFKDLLAKTKEA
jgi:hypothetical protein